MPLTGKSKHSPRLQCPQPECPARFNDTGDLNEHIAMHHRNARRYFCNFPNCSFSMIYKSAFATHVHSHPAMLPYCCRFCSKRCCNPVSIARHECERHGYSPKQSTSQNTPGRTADFDVVSHHGRPITRTWSAGLDGTAKIEENPGGIPIPFSPSGSTAFTDDSSSGDGPSSPASTRQANMPILSDVEEVPRKSGITMLLLAAQMLENQVPTNEDATAHPDRHVDCCTFMDTEESNSWPRRQTPLVDDSMHMSIRRELSIGRSHRDMLPGISTWYNSPKEPAPLGIPSAGAIPNCGNPRPPINPMPLSRTIPNQSGPESHTHGNRFHYLLREDPSLYSTTFVHQSFNSDGKVVWDYSLSDPAGPSNRRF